MNRNNGVSCVGGRTEIGLSIPTPVFGGRPPDLSREDPPVPASRDAELETSVAA